MADFRGLKGFALARESAFFKLEQEADIQRHRSRLVTQGRIEDIAGGYLMPRRQQTLAESAQTFEVLAEVLQQQARLDDPTAAQRKNFFRKIKAQLPQLTDAEVRKYRSSVYGIAAIGHIPRVHLGRDRFVHHRGQQAGPPALRWSPQAKEAAQRAFVTGARSMAYGSALGAVVVLLVIGVAAKAMDISSADELRMRFGNGRPQSADAFQEWLGPVRSSIQGFIGPQQVPLAEQPDSEFRQRLSKKFGPKGPPLQPQESDVQ